MDKRKTIIYLIPILIGLTVVLSFLRVSPYILMFLVISVFMLGLGGSYLSGREAGLPKKNAIIGIVSLVIFYAAIWFLISLWR